MEGYEVVTVADDKVGSVVGESRDYLIVAHGLIHKSKCAVPLRFTLVSDREQLVRITIDKEIVFGSPELDGHFDERAVAEYYRLAQSGSGWEES